MPSSSISGLSGTGSECPICLGTFDNPVFTTCGHRFCQSCIRSHIYVSRLALNQTSQNNNQGPSTQPSCPLCRHPISEQDFVAAPVTTPSVHGVEVLVRFAHGRGSMSRLSGNHVSELSIPLQNLGSRSPPRRLSQLEMRDGASASTSPNVANEDNEGNAADADPTPHRVRHRHRRRSGVTRDPESKQLINRLRNLIILSSFIMIVQGVVSVFFWEYSISSRKVEEKPVGAECRKWNLENSLLETIAIVKQLNASLNRAEIKVKNLMSAIAAGRYPLDLTIGAHISKGRESALRLMQSVQKAWKRVMTCVGDASDPSPTVAAAPSIIPSLTTTLPLVVFVVSVSLVPVLILGLFLFAHKCKS